MSGISLKSNYMDTIQPSLALLTHLMPARNILEFPEPRTLNTAIAIATPFALVAP